MPAFLSAGLREGRVRTTGGGSSFDSDDGSAQIRSEYSFLLHRARIVWILTFPISPPLFAQVEVALQAAAASQASSGACDLPTPS